MGIRDDDRPRYKQVECFGGHDTESRGTSFNGTRGCARGTLDKWSRNDLVRSVTEATQTRTLLLANTKIGYRKSALDARERLSGANVNCPVKFAVNLC